MDELPARDDRGHKGDFGTVAVVGGSATMLGAPCFVASGALRAGAGSVRLAVPEALVLPALGLVPSAIAAPIGDDVERWLAALPPDAVLAVGCGWGHGEDRLETLHALFASPRRLVLDGDGLTLLARSTEPLPRRAPLVLTPHPGEYQRLAHAWKLPRYGAGDAERIAAATALAERTGAIVVLKGAGTVVSDGTSTAVEPSANAALAIPGSGDVLAGLIAALMAQRAEPLAAARLGVGVHALAGAIWRERMGPSGLVAIDLASLVPEAMRRLRERS